MKTIGKKIRAIYFLAIVAIVSICMAILPMMSINVKADTENEIKVVGAQVIVIDGTTSIQNFDGKYAVSFKAEFSKDFYNSLNVNGNVVKFGMLIGPAENYDAVTLDTATENGYDNTCFIGNKETSQYVSFKVGENTFSYEGMKQYNEADITADLTNDAEKVQALLDQSNQNLAAIPYYTVNGKATLVKVENPIVRSARKLINDEYVLSSLENGDNLYARYVGEYDGDYYGCEYYVEKSTGIVYKADANNELAPFFGADFVGAGQLVVNAQDVNAKALDQLTLDEQTLSFLEEGKDYSIASFLDEGNVVRTIKAKVVTKIITTVNDFFKDTNGDGVGDVAKGNTIFHINGKKNSSDNNSTTEEVVQGYYVLAGNINLQNVGWVVSTCTYEQDGVTKTLDTRLFLSISKGGFMGTFDGRGFAISNVVVETVSGFFGLLNGATIKNVAFDGINTTKNDSTPGLLAYNTYNTTFENVYVRVGQYVGTSGDAWISSPRIFGALNEKYGKNVFNNVVVENTNAFVDGNKYKQDRFMFSADTTSIYDNTSVIGLPVNVTTAVQVAANDAEGIVAEHKIVLTLPQATIESFGATAGTVYALTDAVVADDAAVLYANLITNINNGEKKNIKHIEFVADTVVERGYFADLSTLGKDTTVADAYLETGMWAKVGEALAWNSLVAEGYVVKSSNEDPTDMFFADSITLEMYKGNEKLENVKIRPRQEDLDFVTVSGTTITKRPDAILLTNREMIVDVVYTVGSKSYEIAVDLTLEIDYDKVNVYQSGEFIVETTTGKVYMPNKNNELVSFDATGYLEGIDKLYFGGLEVSVLDTRKFTINTSDIDELAIGKQYPFVAVKDGNSQYLLAKLVTKVLFAQADFFVGGTVERSNYIFPANKDAVYGNDGYYVLANNIDLGNCAAQPSGFSVAFSGTLDGRGFALSNIDVRDNGMFGKLEGATIKNIAFDGFRIVNNGEYHVLIARSTLNSTFENVYVRAIEYNMQSHNSLGGTATNANSRAFGKLDNSKGVSTFTNVVYDHTRSLAGAWSQRQSRVFFGNDESATYNNISVVGLPTMVITAAHESAYKIVLTLPQATIESFGAEAGTVYALTDAVVADDAVVTYANLISGIRDKGDKINIQYIEFVADTVAERGYYLDLATLGASEDASEYTATGYWKVSGGALAWASLAGKAHVYEAVITEKTCTQDGYTTYTCTCGCGDSYVLDFVPAGHVLDESGEFCTVCGEYAGDKNIIDTAEFVVDKATGKVFKANDKNELVAYDATSFLNGETAVTVGGVAQTLVTGTTDLAFEIAGLETLTDGEKYLIVAGDNAIIAQVVTKVISTLNDFFVDANGDGTLADSEYIFYQGSSMSTLYDGYYVLANNIAMERKKICINSTNLRPAVSTEYGFQGTFDGRGFALSDISVYYSDGMFGSMHNATIKNLAITEAHLEGNDTRVPLFAYATSNVTVENVYVKMDRARAQAGNYVSYPTIFNGITGTCTFTNVVIENTTGMTMTTDNVKAYATHMDTNGNSVYVNTSIVGVPSNVAWSKDANGVWNTLTMYLPSSELTKLGVSAGQYSIGATELAALEAQYAHLIAGIEKAKKIDITIINLVEDTSGRAYYVDNATLSASTAANGYVATGYWKVVDNALVWASLA